MPISRVSVSGSIFVLIYIIAYALVDATTYYYRDPPKGCVFPSWTRLEGASFTAVPQGYPNY